MEDPVPETCPNCPNCGSEVRRFPDGSGLCERCLIQFCDRTGSDITTCTCPTCTKAQMALE